MGIFNDASSVNAFAINAYCIVSAMFFAACAYAQLNDPNPVQWFCAYVFGGCVPNLYWMTTTTTAGNAYRNRNGNGNGNDNSSTTQKLTMALDGYRLAVVLAIVYKLATVAPKLAKEAEETFQHGWVWAFLEHEEGRDSVGLLLLVGHVSCLNASLKQQQQQQQQQHQRGSGTASRPRWTMSPAVLSVGLLVVLSVCVYVWIVHHPELVAKHGLKHCQGEMFGRIAGEL
eukprot:jgi/Psemu1/12416/gm1.12416_g